ncbi:helix-turn-helix domain-containing protein [Methylobacterium sp. WSM2598]|uniref:helix-turn-helix domain-containing protein n=1 Tax=Methylobacterium sp. WSM2598 TaxID=398261 RepID=UPI00037821FB|nr:helix-turn-helix transcriptional regulator [Methylobacterium sp. WSM2598]
MDLATYLSAHDLKPANFAARIGVPASTITRILRGERDPRGATIRKIVAGTDGAVTAADLLRDRAVPPGAEMNPGAAEARP